MKIKHLLTALLLLLSISASAQIQLLYTNDVGRNVMDRTKKLFWIEGDSDPCFDITNYKKTGNKETFTIKSKEDPKDQYSVSATLNDKGEPTHMVIKNSKHTYSDSDIRTTSGNKDEDNRMYNYFGGLAGYPAKQSVGGSTVQPTSPSTPSVDGDGAVDKVRGAFGKVKNTFKKKK